MKMARDYYERKEDRVLTAVRDGRCGILKNWKEHGCSAEDFEAGVRWLFEEPEDELGRQHREIGLVGGRIHYLERLYDLDGYVRFRDLTADSIYWGKVSVNAADNFQIEREVQTC